MIKINVKILAFLIKNFVKFYIKFDNDIIS